MYNFRFNLKKYDYGSKIPFFSTKYVTNEKNVEMENYLPK